MTATDQAKRIALVTGGNKGIGFETCRALAKAGLTVLLAARNKGLGEDAAGRLRDEGLDVLAVLLDVTRQETISAAAALIERDFGRLDVLVNNAGIGDLGKDGPPSTTSIEAVRRIYDTNVFGVLAVTQTLLPLIRKSASGRIVNVSSSLGSLTLNADPSWDYAAVKPLGYNSSKAALNMMTIHLAYELRDTNIKVNTVNPGYTATDLNGHNGTQTVAEGARGPVQYALLPDDGPTGGFFSWDQPEPW